MATTAPPSPGYVGADRLAEAFPGTAGHQPLRPSVGRSVGSGSCAAGRKATGYSQRLTELGHPVGQSRLAVIEQTGRSVTLDHADAIARALDYPLAALLTSTGSGPVRELLDEIESADDRARAAVERSIEARRKLLQFIDEDKLNPGDLPPHYLQPVEILGAQ